MQQKSTDKGEDRQQSGQSGTSAPFTKVGEVHHSNNKTVSFNMHNPIREFNFHGIQHVHTKGRK